MPERPERSAFDFYFSSHPYFYPIERSAGRVFGHPFKSLMRHAATAGRTTGSYHLFSHHFASLFVRRAPRCVNTSYSLPNPGTSFTNSATHVTTSSPT